MVDVGWDPKPFNEQNPFGKRSSVVGGDNIAFSRERWNAIKAMKAGTATPDQAKLVMDTDAVMSEAVAIHEENQK